MWKKRNNSLQPKAPFKDEFLASIGDAMEPVETQEQFDARQQATQAPAVDQRTQDRINYVRGQPAYEEDPALNAALDVAEAARGNQLRSIEDLSRIVLGNKTIAEQRGGLAGDDLSQQMIAGGDRYTPEQRARARRALASQTLQGAGAERGGQQEAINRAVQAFRRGETADLQLANKRGANRLQAELDRENLVKGYLDSARISQQRARERGVQGYGDQVALNTAAMGLPEPTDYNYGMRAVLGGLGAASTGLSLYNQMQQQQKFDPVTKYLREAAQGSNIRPMNLNDPNTRYGG
jgi:hypothetical protein